ncbi:hypothetical protein [Nocardiopsis sp. MG754419]|uniref:hypothetical protein n=1 Tax=Nocardiopsis sp. MG754419 TaxID=2259865 RepID=UPI001BABB2F9|nr:hypothetical protein [Nocardiopsis sp. MG754419]MBR8741149.1 hypothetical protein [Nocardiopsis sp. MG754419]
MSLVLIAFGATLVSVALFNKMPRVVPGYRPVPRHGGGVAAAPRAVAPPRLRLVEARLTEQGRAVFTAIGGSALIVAFFLALSGL